MLEVYWLALRPIDALGPHTWLAHLTGLAVVAVDLRGGGAGSGWSRSRPGAGCGGCCRGCPVGPVGPVPCRSCAAGPDLDPTLARARPRLPGRRLPRRGTGRTRRRRGPRRPPRPGCRRPRHRLPGRPAARRRRCRPGRPSRTGPGRAAGCSSRSTGPRHATPARPPRGPAARGDGGGRGSPGGAPDRHLRGGRVPAGGLPAHRRLSRARVGPVRALRVHELTGPDGLRWDTVPEPDARGAGRGARGRRRVRGHAAHPGSLPGPPGAAVRARPGGLRGGAGPPGRLRSAGRPAGGRPPDGRRLRRDRLLDPHLVAPRPPGAGSRAGGGDGGQPPDRARGAGPPGPAAARGSGCWCTAPAAGWAAPPCRSPRRWAGGCWPWPGRRSGASWPRRPARTPCTVRTSGSPRCARGGGVDVVVDPVGGEVFEQSVRCLAPEGRLLTVGFTSGVIPAAAANRLLLRNAGVLGAAWRELVELEPRCSRHRGRARRAGRRRTAAAGRRPLRAGRRGRGAARHRAPGGGRQGGAGRER